MNYKPDEKEWMAYLYGELGDEDKRKFDEYLLGNPGARQELEYFENLRRLLSSTEDKEVIAPSIIAENHSGVSASGHRHFWTVPYFRAITTAAASLILIILVGRLTGTQLAVSDNELRLSFGAPAIEAVKDTGPTRTVTEDDVRKLIHASIENNNHLMQSTLEETQKKLDSSIRNHLAVNSGNIDQVVREASTASQEQIRQFVDGIRTENMQQVKDYFQLTSTEQKKYIENLLVDFAKYLQQQRNDDLKLVQMRMNSLEQNTDLFKHETEQILSSIITSVGTTRAVEIKN